MYHISKLKVTFKIFDQNKSILPQLSSTSKLYDVELSYWLQKPRKPCCARSIYFPWTIPRVPFSERQSTSGILIVFSQAIDNLYRGLLA